MNTKTATASVLFSTLPALGTDLEGGTFAGITTLPNGTHCAVVLLPAKGKDLTWEAAKAWAHKQGGELPSRPVAALLFANIKPALTPDWHWTADEYSTSYAWVCSFSNGYQSGSHKSNELAAVAVRRL